MKNEMPIRRQAHNKQQLEKKENFLSLLHKLALTRFRPHFLVVVAVVASPRQTNPLWELESYAHTRHSFTYTYMRQITDFMQSKIKKKSRLSTAFNSTGMQVQHVKELQCYCIQRALPTIVTSRVVTEIKVQSNKYAL